MRGAAAASPGHRAQLRSGAAHVVRGGADVRLPDTADAADGAEAQGSGGEAQWLPASIPLAASDIAASGVLRARTIEFTQTEERPVVSTEAVVREELVVRRTVERRERIVEETVRHTGVDIEDVEERPSD